MIVGHLKDLSAIAASVRGHKKILALGCGGCVTVCRSGGAAEAEDLTREISHPRHHAGIPPVLTTATIERQCERDIVRDFLKLPEGTDAILSLACGAGVQIVADVFDPLPVIPALSTTFLGGADEPGVWREKCRGCGDCLLTRTGGICPIALCAKSLLHGPCGGSRGGHCEVGGDTECAWAKIYARLERQGRLDLLEQPVAVRDWRCAGGAGPREHRRTGVELRFGKT
ncbi:MAG: methylenetetrahydrofolate reductase C-terminal domain-containing protein [Deltaproteobacteria bacterium]|nr:methylenetetrahydrofolate reductase C-terminal domain-containing protein [Deltaproteobacteria bacterium]